MWFNIYSFLFFKKKISISYETRLIFIPTDLLLKISVIFIIFFLPDFIVYKFSFHPGHVLNRNDIPESIFYETIYLNFLRLSEVHELIFCFYFLIYSIAFKQAGDRQNKTF